METEKRNVGPFELGQRLGVGGMGVVYLGTYTKTGEKVAVKVLSPELNADKRLQKRFVREMAILKKLRHKNIVRCFGGGFDGTQHYYAMELMDAGSLERVLKKKGKLPWEQVIEIGRQVAKALEHAHNHGIIHRDLKPANLFLSKDGRLKLGDFGIARDTQATALTAAGRTVGTYAYMAPEQISGKPPVSRKTDLYALGCVMFELLTGRTPFVEENAAQMLFAHLELEPPRVTSFAIDCPIWLEEVVMRLLEKDPEERYYDALATQVALQEVGTKVAEQKSIAQQTAEGGSSTVAERSEAVRILTGASKQKKRKKKRKTAFYEQVWFLAGCLILLVGVTWWAMQPLSEEQLFTRAQPLMETDDPEQWRTAREKYLGPLLAKYPDGEYATKAQEYIELIDTNIAERQAIINARFQRESKTDGERLFREAWKYEQASDRIMALYTYHSMIKLLGRGDQGPTIDDRPFLNLARRNFEKLQASGDYLSDTELEMHAAEQRATVNAQKQREPETEGERLFREARGFETRMGDRVSALETYRHMVKLLNDSERDRPFVNLARRKIAEIESAGDLPQDTVAVVNDALKRAEESFTQGEVIKAKEIWNSVTTLYAGNKELEQQVKYARARLAGEDVEPIDFGPKPEAKNDLEKPDASEPSVKSSNASPSP